MAEIATLTAVFTADLSSFEIGVGKATALMSSANGRIGADLSAIASASVGMSATVISSMHGISIAIQSVMRDLMALKNAMTDINGMGGGAVKSKPEGGGTQIQGGMFVFNGVQDVNSLYDALEDVSKYRSPL
ncbi:MAG TPA: hypothetical protein PLZ51_12005 [Aggregatilineales bacterium]|mgnify:CR=1 FL=1|nr:hypothetical protein [Aggregatilineales bacterium]